jgi:SWI/SNF-related matrix-associated actin-dependent regulator of chromatin subfamily A3
MFFFSINITARSEKKANGIHRAEAEGTLDKYRSTGPNGRTTYSHVLEVLLRMRQVCNHWALCKNRVDKLMAMLEKDQVVELTPENIKALQDMLQVQIESQETCAICLDSLSEPVITACAHAFDKGCITQVIERQHKCPLCRAEIKDANSLVSPATELGEDAGAVEVDASAPSSKIEALIKILSAKGQTEGTKSVVFSQWTSFLDVVEPHLTQHGIRFTRIDGKLNSNKRDQAIAEFSNDPNCTVLLASLNVCSVGLNLVAANQVVLCDSWWAPAIEDQAIDRVYRLGQTRETTVWRLVMDGSVEDQVLEIQENKRALSSTALSEAGHKKGESTNSRLADLEKLLRKKDS